MAPETKVETKTTDGTLEPHFDLGTELNKFETQVAMAVHEKEEWVEAHPKIIEYFNRRGLGKSKFFLYKGIKICPFGAAEGIINEINEPIYQRLHGGLEGIVEGTHG